MKILVLMPLDEKYIYTGVGLFKALPEEIKDKTFCMPMFMDYLIQTEQTKNYEWAVVDTIISGVSVYKTAVKLNEDLIIIGNIPAEYPFDAVFNFQDVNEELPYEDKFIENFIKIINNTAQLTDEDRTNLFNVLGNLHKADESKMKMVNFAASADFLTTYLKTDPKLDKIKKQYDERIKTLQQNINKYF